MTLLFSDGCMCLTLSLRGLGRRRCRHRCRCRLLMVGRDNQVFFCKYNDPIYVKMEKLETIIRLVNDRNIDQVLQGTTARL